jgi:voltage-gated potassium channel
VQAIWRRAAITALVLPVIVLGGAFAYMAVEGWSFGDALYMTVITISTVGYREVYPLSAAGRWVTYAVLLGGISWLAVWFATVTAFFIESDVFHVFRHRRLEREVRALENHVIVCGAGRTGTQVVAELLRSGAPYVAIDVDEERLAELRGAAPHLRLMQGDATRDEVLVRAGIQKAAGLVAALPDDAENLFVTITARALKPDLTIVSRVNDDDNVAKLYRAGADHIVSPQRIGGARMASLLLRPGVTSLVDVITRGGVSLSIEEIPVTDGSELTGRSLGELEIPQRTGSLVVALKRNEGHAAQAFQFNPTSSTRVESGDMLVVMGEPDQIDRLRRLAMPQGKT